MMLNMDVINSKLLSLIHFCKLDQLVQTAYQLQHGDSVAGVSQAPDVFGGFFSLTPPFWCQQGSNMF